ncbi:Protein CBG26432 [Caenorhabditis briggsae]|uniref:Protein CBG26432 n=1 Tax=Caenorhabditis briggsae TaxID=6238 RepID=B6IEW9_CAEBR|nr:Protein CBG26432 [Caenorhabditis briggsae]CAR98449.1 Protein CBG26432 [Caenorhabditis briggsae]
MGDTATSRYKYYDSIELPAVYQDIEYYDDKPFIEVKKLENDPVFVDECVALDWEIKTPYRKIISKI